MVRFRAATENRFFEFDKVSDFCRFFHFGVSAQMRERSDGAVVSDFRIGDDAVVQNFDVAPDARIGDARSGAHRAAVADDGFAFNRDVRVD